MSTTGDTDQGARSPDGARSLTWDLTEDEQVRLLELLLPTHVVPHALKHAMADADLVFGKVSQILAAIQHPNTAGHFGL